MLLSNKMIVVVIAFGVLIICECVHSDNYDLARQYEPNPLIKICGTPLINLLTDICAEMMKPRNSERRSIRANSMSDSDYRDYDWYRAVKDPSYPFVSKRSIQSVFGTMRLKKEHVGLADECCKKSCTLDEMKGYCHIVQEN